MGSGNQTYGDELRGEGKGSFLTLAHALRLASHPQYPGSVKGLGTEPRGCRAADRATGVQVLTLAAEDAGDGKAADWGVWLAPELVR